MCRDPSFTAASKSSALSVSPMTKCHANGSFAALPVRIKRRSHFPPSIHIKEFSVQIISVPLLKHNCSKVYTVVIVNRKGERRPPLEPLSRRHCQVQRLSDHTFFLDWPNKGSLTTDNLRYSDLASFDYLKWSTIPRT